MALFSSLFHLVRIIGTLYDYRKRRSATVFNFFLKCSSSPGEANFPFVSNIISSPSSFFNNPHHHCCMVANLLHPRPRQADRCAGIPLENSWTPLLKTHTHIHRQFSVLTLLSHLKGLGDLGIPFLFESGNTASHKTFS